MMKTLIKEPTLKRGDKLYYWDHGQLRRRWIDSVSIIDTTDTSYEELRQLREKLHRTNIPKYIVDVTFNSDPDKHILMCHTSVDGQWSTGTIYYWDDLSKWEFRQDIRELLLNEKIDRALADIAYARRQLESISDKYRKLRRTVIV